MEKKTSLNWVDYFSQKTQRADCFGVEKMVDKVGGSFVPSEKEQRDAIVEVLFVFPSLFFSFFFSSLTLSPFL